MDKSSRENWCHARNVKRNRWICLEIDFMSEKIIDLNVQRWMFERGNYQIIIENAWSLNPYYSQERITVNGERVRNRIDVKLPVLFWRTVFEDAILDPNGELNLKVQWKSGLWSVGARLLIEDTKHPWIDFVQNKWTGPKGQWPDYIEHESWNG